MRNALFYSFLLILVGKIVYLGVVIGEQDGLFLISLDKRDSGKKSALN